MISCQRSLHKSTQRLQTMPPRRSRRLTTAPLPISSPSTSSAPDVSKKRLVSIDCLPDAVLLHVLASIKPVDTTYARSGIIMTKCQCALNGLRLSTLPAFRESLPLVCKRWKHLLQSPSAIWEVCNASAKGFNGQSSMPDRFACACRGYKHMLLARKSSWTFAQSLLLIREFLGQQLRSGLSQRGLMSNDYT